MLVVKECEGSWVSEAECGCSVGVGCLVSLGMMTSGMVC